jgi:TRAP transporter 4TM/12TM fusion protein
LTGPAPGQIDAATAEALEKRYDSEMRFRPLAGPVAGLVSFGLVALSAFHYYTAGFGILVEHWHVAVHLAAVLALSFLMFPMRVGAPPRVAIGGVPVLDWALALLSIGVVLYLPVNFDALTFRIGVPNQLDQWTGWLLVLVVLEATRRAMGPVLPLIVITFIAYGLFGDRIGGILAHPGSTPANFISHITMTQEGIFGTPVKVVATFVFHFVLFGVLAMRMGLGQFFLDLATVFAGRMAGGPAKVSIFGSAMFGTISGSSIANTVTTGSLTIPAMRRVGYRPHFAAAVEAAASAGGQITPPIMGAAAFIMVEFLSIPYGQIILAAIVPAAMHYIGVLVQVHFEAKKTGIAGLPESEIPRLVKTLREGWITIIPMVLLVWTIADGSTPYLAAFRAISACLVLGVLNPNAAKRMRFADVWVAFDTGARYALAVGCAAAAVGIVVGVITLTGAGFRISYMVTNAAAQAGTALLPWLQLLPFQVTDAAGLQLFFSLVFVALASVVLGTGLPTTALYIVLAAITAPTLQGLGVVPIAAHLFILYYGILADLTPPVCVAAYAAAGIAGADPFRTGNTAFRLGLAKATVPFVFAYAPVMLIIVPGFTWQAFLVTTLTCAAGVALLGIGLTGYLFTNMSWPARLLLLFAALLLMAPSVNASLIGAALALPITGLNWLAARGRAPAARPRLP